jgi:hypothetical protein
MLEDLKAEEKDKRPNPNRSLKATRRLFYTSIQREDLPRLSYL